MMLGEESRSADYWKACGDEALRNGIKGIIMMGAHWDARGVNRIDVAMNPAPEKSPLPTSTHGNTPTTSSTRTSPQGKSASQR